MVVILIMALLFAAIVTINGWAETGSVSMLVAGIILLLIDAALVIRLNRRQ